LLATPVLGQKYSVDQVFAHNDYEQDEPFFTAYSLRVGYIEADVFLEGDDLMVAHHRSEIRQGRNLRTLYLDPLNDAVRKNRGLIYPESDKWLTFMIDLKTEGVSTLNTLVEQLKKYPDLIASRTLRFMISGSVPSPDLWKNYPSYIFFDGRPGTPYTADQWERIHMISTGFTSHMKWDGKSPLSDEQRSKIKALAEGAHQHGKPFRFWATPDSQEAWKYLIDAGMDVIGTDDVRSLVTFIKNGGD
jgi:alkaline phosphatase